jgi:3-oxoadipate enol-lactonase
MKIKANGIIMNYELSGEGKCLTLIHGMGSNLNAWRYQVPAFSNHYRVLAYDVRGHGQTESNDEELTIELWVADLYALLRVLNINDTFLLGHSMGGSIALQFTLKYANIVNALILSSSVGARGRSQEEIHQGAIARQAEIEAIKKDGMKVVVKNRLGHNFSPGFVEKNPEIAEWYKSIQLQNTIENYLRLIKHSEHPSPKPDLSKIPCPTLIMAGEYDFGVLAEATAFQKGISGSQFKVFPTIHATYAEVPQDYNETVLKFLAGLTCR